MATRLRTTEHIGPASLVTLIGLGLLIHGVVFLSRHSGDWLHTLRSFVMCIVGLWVVIVGYVMARKLICSNCGNRVEKTSRLCPACRETLEPRSLSP